MLIEQSANKENLAVKKQKKHSAQLKNGKYGASLFLSEKITVGKIGVWSNKTGVNIHSAGRNIPSI